MQKLKKLPTIQYDFLIASTGDMEALGKAFGEFLDETIQQQDNKFLRIGISSSDYNSGKTTFSKGLINTFTDVTKEQLDGSPFVKHTESVGQINHFDWEGEEDYRHTITSPVERGIAIIEHADQSSLDFNYWVHINVNEDGSRHVTISIGEDEAFEDPSLKFLEKAESVSKPTP